MSGMTQEQAQELIELLRQQQNTQLDQSYSHSLVRFNEQAAQNAITMMNNLTQQTMTHWTEHQQRLFKRK